MQFHQWQTLLDEAGQIHGKEWRRKPAVEQYEEELRSLIMHPFQNEATRSRRIIRLGIEIDWMRQGRPYYNVHPQMALKLAKTNLDKIPAKFIEVPGGFPTICIRFTDNIPIRVMPIGQGFHASAFPELKDAPVGFRSVLFGKFNFDHDEFAQSLSPNMIGQDQYVLCVDEGCRAQYPNTNIYRTLCNTVIFGVKPEETIPEAIDRATAEVKGTMEEAMFLAMRTRLENLFRIIITTGFLSNCPEDMLVIPDVLADDRQRYWDALQKGLGDDAARIAARAKRRGKLGWNVGTNEMFVGARPFQPSHKAGDGSRELYYSHIREGHPHAVRFGPEKSQVKIKWYRAIRVRSDLPFSAE